MKNNEGDRLLEELRKELAKIFGKVMMEAINSPKVREAFEKLKKKGIIPKPPEIKLDYSVSQRQMRQIFQKLPPEVKQNIKELQQEIQQGVEEGVEERMEDPQVTEKIENLKKQGIEIKIMGFGIDFAILVSKDIFTPFELTEEDKRLLKQWNMRWN